MRHTIKTVTAVSITLLALTASTQAHATSDGTEVAVGQPPVPYTTQPQVSVSASCPEYTRGRRVLAGEFQDLECDVSPPQVLDLVMYPRRLNGETWRQRCLDHGGRPWSHRDGTKRCQDVDY